MTNRFAESILCGMLFSCSLFSNFSPDLGEMECEDELVQSHSIFLTFQNVDGGGLGYDVGYASLKGAFFLVNHPHNCLNPFLDVRLHKFKVINSSCDRFKCKSDWAANVGAGIRVASECRPSIFGFNLYYDYRSGARNFDQLGFGLEWFNPCFDIRFNLYRPFDDKKLIKRCTFDDYIGDFFIIQDKFQTAFNSADFAIGHSYCYNDCLDFYGNIGIYYIGGKFCNGRRDFFGPRLRLKAFICDYFSVEGIFTYDRHFKGRAQGLFTFTIPLGGCCVPRDCYNPCISEPIYRNEIMIFDQFCKWKWNF